MFKSLAVRLVLLLGISIVFIVGVTSYVNHREYGALVSDRIVDTIRQDLRVGISRLVLQAAEVRSDLRFLALSQPDRSPDMLDSNAAAIESHMGLLNSYMGSHPNVLQIQFIPYLGVQAEPYYLVRENDRIFIADHNVYYPTGSPSSGPLASATEHGQMYTSEILPHFNKEDGADKSVTYITLFSTAVISEEGRPVGVMTMQVDVGAFFRQEQSFLKFLNTDISGVRGNFVTDAGDYLLRTDTQHRENYELGATRKVSQDWPEAARFIEHNAGKSHQFYSDDGDRVVMLERFNVGSSDHPKYLYALMVAPLDTVFADLYQLQSRVLMFTLMLLVFVLVISSGYIQTRLKTLKNLNKQMDLYQPDQPFTPIEVKGQDEISDVTTSFNHLGKQLHDLFAHDNRVRDGLNQVASVSVMDLNGTILDGNDKLVKAFGFEGQSEEFFGTSVLSFRSGLHEKEYYENFWGTLRQGQVWRGDLSFKIRSGEIIWFDMSVIPLFDERGGVYRVLTVMIDVTERLKLIREIERERNRAEHASRVKSDFLASMSHELRTPLNSIIGFSQRLIRKLQGELDPRHMDAIETIERNGQHLLQVINEILDVSKIEAGQMTIQHGQFELTRVIRDVQLTMSTQAKAKHLSLEVEVPEDNVLVFLDRKKLVQTLLNLVSNAVKYTDVGGAVIRLTEDGDWIHLAVEDTGMGIKQEDQEKLFARFTQLESTVSQRVEGTGLGLVLANEFTTMQGGMITVDSTVGEGSTFTIRLPKRLDISRMREKDNISLEEH